MGKLRVGVLMKFRVVSGNSNYENLRQQLIQIEGFVQEFGSKALSRDFKLRAVIPLSFNPSDYDPEDWEFELEDAEKFKFIRVEILLSGDTARILLQSGIIPDLIDESEISIDGRKWEYNKYLTSMLPKLPLSEVVSYELLTDN